MASNRPQTQDLVPQLHLEQTKNFSDVTQYDKTLLTSRATKIMQNFEVSITRTWFHSGDFVNALHCGYSTTDTTSGENVEVLLAKKIRSRVGERVGEETGSWFWPASVKALRSDRLVLV